MGGGAASSVSHGLIWTRTWVSAVRSWQRQGSYFDAIYTFTVRSLQLNEKKRGRMLILKTKCLLDMDDHTSGFVVQAVCPF